MTVTPGVGAGSCGCCFRTNLMSAQPSCRGPMSVSSEFGAGSDGCRFRTNFVSAQPSCRRSMAATFEFVTGSRSCRFRSRFMPAQSTCRWRIWQLHSSSVPVHADAVFVPHSCRRNHHIRGQWPMTVMPGLGAGSRGCRFRTNVMSAQPSYRWPMAHGSYIRVRCRFTWLPFSYQKGYKWLVDQGLICFAVGSAPKLKATRHLTPCIFLVFCQYKPAPHIVDV